VVVLGYGGVVHVVHLVVGSFHPYSWAPTWLAIYFTSLTLADPLAALLLAARRASGLYLGAVVLVTDAVANGYAIYGLGSGTAVARVSQAMISFMAVAALALAPCVRSWLWPGAVRSSMRQVTRTAAPGEPQQGRDT
jgi:hypothetical protein